MLILWTLTNPIDSFKSSIASTDVIFKMFILRTIASFLAIRSRGTGFHESGITGTDIILHVLIVWTLAGSRVLGVRNEGGVANACAIFDMLVLSTLAVICCV
jgi:hypothetical protein